MNEIELRSLIEQVRRGELPRRAFLQQMVGLGLTVPMASSMLMQAGIAQAQTPSGYKPTKRGGGGALKVLWWQGATLLNPHFAVGTKDQEGSRIFYEPLAAWDNDGNLVPVLAAEIPSIQGGGLTADGKTVIWKLKRDVQWHDGKPFTADDCVFTWQYAANPETAATTSGPYKNCTVEKIDSHTIKITFAKPTPFWADPLVGTAGMILPKHLFEAYIGAKSREAPTNLKPVGTGAYKFVDFKPGDMIRGEINNNYHMPNRPHFDTIEMKGGGDAVSAARAVLQTGEYDYAWNLQVEGDVLKRLEAGGRGRTQNTPTGNIEHIQLNSSDPWTEVDGERSNPKTKHPFFGDPLVREAMTLLVDRQSIQDHVYARPNLTTVNFLNRPERFRSKNLKWEFNPEKAAELLEKAGWKKGADGIREKNGKKLKLVYQTSINSARQKCQQIVKQACQKAGIDVELKSITASVFFSSDVANPDTYSKFNADVQMFTTTMTQPDPEYFMAQHTSWEIASKANKWQGRNIHRWSDEEYDKTYRTAESELDPIKRAAMFIRMNDLVCGANVVIAVAFLPRTSGISTKLVPLLSGFDNDMYALYDWYRQA